MNRNDDFDHTLRAWLRREAPLQAPDRVLEAALERVADVSQRRSWQQRLFGVTPMSSRRRVATVTAVVALAVLAGLQLRGLLPDVGESSPSPTASSSPSATPPAVVAPDNLLPPYSVASVLEELELREGPGVGGPVLTTIAAGQVVWIQGSGEFGPVTTGGVTYYPASFALNYAGWPAGVDGGFQGWVPTERDGVPLVELAPVVCPVDAPRPGVLAGMTAWARLTCYGRGEVVLEGSWVNGSGGIWPWDGEPAWLVPPDVERAISGADGQFSFVLAPNVVVPAGLEAVGGRVRITGHFDDPAAATCVIRAGEPIVEQPAGSVHLFCRERFVATSLELLEISMPSLSPAVGCVGSPPDVAVVSGQTDPVACFGNAPLTFDALLDGAGAVDCPGSVEPAWLYCPDDGVLMLVGETRKLGAPFLLLVVDPTSGFSLSAYFGTNVRVTGHFDDPAAQTCRENGSFPGESPRPAAGVIESCRVTFVVTDVVPL